MTLASTVKKSLPLLLITSLLAGCNGFFDKDNTPTPTPLTTYQAALSPQLLWSTQAGKGTDGDYLKLTPAVDNQTAYTASTDGSVTAIQLASGNKLWQTDTDTALTTGTAADSGIVVVGSRHGDIFALSESTGKIRWKTTINGELLANPAIGQGHVIVKTIDGTVRSLDASTGKTEWSQQQAEPTLILRASSTPVITNNAVLAGFANGNLVKMSLNTGVMQWMQPIATPDGIFPIERMIDIDANPVVYHQRVFAATYQGNISSLSLDSGEVLWTHDISSYTGMDADDSAAFVTDTQGYVYSFDANSGLVNWRQTDLKYRVLTAPVIMGDAIVVGDAEGYLHWLSRQDGRFLGRISTGAPLYAAPFVQNNVLYAFTTGGKLLAYRQTAH